MTIPPDQLLPQSLGYEQPRQSDGGQVLKHSRLGIASFLIGLVIGLGNLSLIAAAAVMGQHRQAKNSPALIALGLLFVAGMGLSLVGIGLGVAGVIQRDRRKVLAVVGLCFNGAALLAVEALMFIGLAMKK
jgi:cytochrome c biogenesis protein CcdA